MTEDSGIRISDEQYAHLSALIHHHFGIHLTPQKRMMVTSRLQRVLRSTGFDTFEEYYQSRILQPTRKNLSELVNVLSTNHTHFYREPAHFRYLEEIVLPEQISLQTKRRSLDLRVWCAASSTGEEPYTLAMILREVLGSAYSRWEAGLLATDICEDVLETARKGIYERENVEALPKRFQRYFVQEDSEHLRVNQTILADLTFARFNLMNRSFPFRKPFNVTFCRNVMIYFDEPTKRALVERIYNHTAPEGYLFIGHAEAIPGSRFRSVAPGVYKRV